MPGVGDKRKLTGDEIAKVRRYVLDRERARYPDLVISVSVKPELKEDGTVDVVIRRRRHSEIPHEGSDTCA